MAQGRLLDTDGQVIHPATGTPQGGIVSPILANVYLHYALDRWFEQTVKAHCRGPAYLCRYADDFVCAVELESDAQRCYAVLGKRLEKFGLETAPDKTRLIQFDQSSKQRFEFLGFEFYWGKSRKGKICLKRRTSRKKYRASLANFNNGCKAQAHLPKLELFTKLNRKLRGYWNYYGIRGNYQSLGEYFYFAQKILWKQLNRRSQRRSYTWVGFKVMLKHFRLTKPRICHSF